MEVLEGWKLRVLSIKMSAAMAQRQYPLDSVALSIVVQCESLLQGYSVSHEQLCANMSSESAVLFAP